MSRRSSDLTPETAAAIGRGPAENRPRLDATSSAGAPIDRAGRAQREEEAGHLPSGHEPLTARPSPSRLPALGPLEYTLLGLIALGIAITVAMALLNP